MKSSFSLDEMKNQPFGQVGTLSEALKKNWFVLLVRHSGCTFCRESLAEVAKMKSAFTDQGIRLAIVHMGDEKSGKELAKAYNLEWANFVSDPERQYYRLFALPEGNLNQLFGPQVWVRGLVAGVFKGHVVGMLQGNGFQLGGVVALANGEVRSVYVSKHAGDLPDWPSLFKRNLFK